MHTEDSLLYDRNHYRSDYHSLICCCIVQSIYENHLIFILKFTFLFFLLVFTWTTYILAQMSWFTTRQNLVAFLITDVLASLTLYFTSDFRHNWHVYFLICIYKKWVLNCRIYMDPNLIIFFTRWHVLMHLCFPQSFHLLHFLLQVIWELQSVASSFNEINDLPQAQVVFYILLIKSTASQLLHLPEWHGSSQLNDFIFRFTNVYRKIKQRNRAACMNNNQALDLTRFL